MTGKRVLVVGPGALGVLIAARLSAAGHDVTVAVRSSAPFPEIWTAIDEKGAAVQARVATIAKPKGAGRFDALVLTPKCDDAPEALRTWLPTLRSKGPVIAIQNGVMGDELAQIAADRLVECTVAFPATLKGPGLSEQTGPGAFILGAWPDGRLEGATPLAAAAELMAEVETTRVSENMAGIKWTKLLINSAITGLGAMTGAELGTLFADKRGRDAAIEIVTEGYRAGLADGVHYEKVAGFHPKMVAVDRPNPVANLRAHTVLKVFGRKFRRQRSSSLQSLERGRRTEVHHLNGFLVGKALAHDLSAKVNGEVTARIALIEAGKRTPSMELLDGLPIRR